METRRSAHRAGRRTARAAVLGLVFAGLAPLAGADGGGAGLIHACVLSAQGRVRIVGANEACTGNETPLHWSIVGPPGPAGPAGPAGAAGGAFYQVVDSAGAVLGPVVSLEFLNPVVGFAVGGRPFVLKLVNGQLYGYAVVYFESPDCTGPGYVQRFPGTLPTTAVDRGYQVYVDGGQPPRTVAARSYGVTDGCIPVAFSLDVVPAPVVLELAGQFVPPFRLQ